MKPVERKPYLKIGEVARLVGVSPSVIRSWESLGLTHPRRTASKYQRRRRRQQWRNAVTRRHRRCAGGEGCIGKARIG